MGYTAKDGDSFYVPMHFNTIVSLYKSYKLSISSNLHNYLRKTTEIYTVVLRPHIMRI